MSHRVAVSVCPLLPKNDFGRGAELLKSTPSEGKRCIFYRSMRPLFVDSHRILSGSLHIGGEKGRGGMGGGGGIWVGHVGNWSGICADGWRLYWCGCVA